jgi:hypothetical protein
MYIVTSEHEHRDYLKNKSFKKINLWYYVFFDEE